MIYCTSIRPILENEYWLKSKLVVKHDKVENAENEWSLNEVDAKNFMILNF